MFRRMFLGTVAVVSLLAVGGSSAFAGGIHGGPYGHRHPGVNRNYYGPGHNHHRHVHVPYYRPMVVAPRPIVVVPRPVYAPPVYGYQPYGFNQGYGTSFGYSSPGFGLYINR